MRFDVMKKQREHTGWGVAVAFTAIVAVVIAVKAALLYAAVHIVKAAWS